MDTHNKNNFNKTSIERRRLGPIENEHFTSTTGNASPIWPRKGVCAVVGPVATIRAPKVFAAHSSKKSRFLACSRKNGTYMLHRTIWYVQHGNGVRASLGDAVLSCWELRKTLPNRKIYHTYECQMNSGKLRAQRIPCDSSIRWRRWCEGVRCCFDGGQKKEAAQRWRRRNIQFDGRWHHFTYTHTHTHSHTHIAP